MKKQFIKKIDPMMKRRISKKKKEKISVIIFSSGKCEDVHECIRSFEGHIKYELPIINGVAAMIPSNNIYKLSKNHRINYIAQDAHVRQCMDIVAPSLGSTIANKSGYTGKNIGVAVIDTGIAPHYDLTRQSNRIIAFKDFVNKRDAPYDDNGHGTHVAGIIGGDGYINKNYKGIAPKANIIGIKVLDKNGSGSSSDVIAGIQWVVDHKDEYNIKIISLSLGSFANISYRNDPLAMACSQAVNQGLVVVVSAGNDGPNKKTINSPGITPNVITVGCTDDKNTVDIKDDHVADFSSEGPTIDGYLKPDLVAPGVNIISLKNDRKGYISYSGTSMSTPVVSGVAALILQKYPELKPKEVKKIMKNSATKLNASKYAQGSGLIDLRKILEIKENKVTTIK